MAEIDLGSSNANAVHLNGELSWKAQSEKVGTSAKDLSFTIVNWLSRILAVIITALILTLVANGSKNPFGPAKNVQWTESDPGKLFGFHPLFMMIAMVVLYGQANIIFRVFRNGHLFWLKLAHAASHTIALALVFLAYAAVYKSLHVRKTPHMFSAHSWLGISVIVMYACQWLCGIIAFLIPATPERIRRLYMPIHRFFGGGLFVSATGVSLMGLYRYLAFVPKYVLLPPPLRVGNSLAVIVFLHAAAVVYLLIKDEYKRARLPSD